MMSYRCKGGHQICTECYNCAQFKTSGWVNKCLVCKEVCKGVYRINIQGGILPERIKKGMEEKIKIDKNI